MVYNDTTSAVANSVLPSSTGTSSKSCKTCFVSLRYALVCCTAGWIKVSRYCPILDVRDSIPFTMGLPGGLILSLCNCRTVYITGILHDSGNRNLDSFLFDISFFVPRCTNFSSSFLYWVVESPNSLTYVDSSGLEKFHPNIVLSIELLFLCLYRRAISQCLSFSSTFEFLFYLCIGSDAFFSFIVYPDLADQVF